MDTADEVEEKLTQIQCQLEELAASRQRRVKVNFSAEEDRQLDEQIDKLTTDVFSNIKDCERKLKQTQSDKPTQGEEQICSNLQQAYRSRLRDCARDLRTIEREHLERVTKLYGEDLDLL